MKNKIANRAIEILSEEGIRSFSRKVSDYAAAKLGFFGLSYDLLRIKRLKRDCTLDELLDFAFNDYAVLIKPGQVQSEASELLEIVNRMKPKVTVEIGTANGGTLFLFSHVASEGATIVSIDLPGGRFGGGYPAWRTLLYRSFALPGQKIHLLRADSHDRDTLEQVKAILDGREIDFLFIDGDHTYEGVKMDFETYGSLVRRGGIIAFHDIVIHPVETGCDVSKFWREIKDNCTVREIVQEWSQNWAGIGLLYPQRCKR